MELDMPYRVERGTVVARIHFYNGNGDPHYETVVEPRIQHKTVVDTSSPKHTAMVMDLMALFNLKGPHERSNQRSFPDTISDPNHPCLYTPIPKVFANPWDAWSMHIFIARSEMWAHKATPALAAQIREVRNQMAAETKAQETATRTARRVAAKADDGTVKEKRPNPMVTPKADRTLTLAELPTDDKCARFLVPGKGEMPIKVMGKTHRDMANPNGSGRVPNPDVPRTANDDLFTYKATSYQLGHVSEIVTSAKGIFIVGTNGVTILQKMRKADAEFKALLESAAEKGGYKGTPRAV